MSIEEILERLSRYFTNDDVEVQDLSGGGDHFQISIRSNKFSGLNRLERHRMVYDLYHKELLSGDIHALSLDLKDLGE